MAAPLWQHQKDALEFIDGKPAVMLAMDMGTGKSRAAIEALVHRGCKRILVLCPSSVVDVWPAQFAQHCPVPHSVAALRAGAVAQRQKHAEDVLRSAAHVGAMAVVVINYEACWRAPFGKWALAQEWDALVLDESHRAKSPGGVAARWVSRLARKVPFRLALTGTPMPHSPLDIYAQYRALDPSIFGTSFTRFKNRYAIIDTSPGFPAVRGFQNQDELNQKFYSIAFRVGAEVLDLPEAMHETRYCVLSGKAHKFYRNLERDFYADVEKGEITAANAMVRGLRLQQLTSGFGKLADAGEEVQLDTAKRELLADLLADLDEPVVCFARFRHDLDTVHQVAARGSLELSGRRNELAEWRAGGAPVLAAQIQSGSVGVDLTRARVCVFYSHGLSLGDYTQALARVHRPGQSRPVVYYHLICAGTVDEKVVAALRERRDVIEEILARRLIHA